MEARVIREVPLAVVQTGALRCVKKANWGGFAAVMGVQRAWMQGQSSNCRKLWKMLLVRLLFS